MVGLGLENEADRARFGFGRPMFERGGSMRHSGRAMFEVGRSKRGEGEPGLGLRRPVLGGGRRRFEAGTPMPGRG